jgi:transcriptional regulator with XRE-family HTH domain
MARTAKALSQRPPRPPRKVDSAARSSRGSAGKDSGDGAGSLVVSLAQQLQSWAGAMLNRVGDASDTALTLAAARTQAPGRKAAVEKAAALLRDLRQAAGLTLEDLGQALELDDPGFIGLVESGKVGLPFELILRLASVLARNDPVGFIMKMTRTYNPKIWKTLDALGLGKLLVHAGREREFANIYRRHDEARRLSDKDFAAALAFADAAFEAALAFQLKHRRGGPRQVAADDKPPAPGE